MNQNLIAMTLLGMLVVVSGVLDWRTGKVHNAWLAPMTCVGVIFWTVNGAMDAGASGAWQGFTEAGVGFLAGLAPFYLIFVMGGLGGGDVKLMAAVGAVSGSWECVLATAMYSLVIAALMAVVVMVKKGLVKRTLGRLLGAALMAGGKVKADLDDEDTPRIPFAVAVAIGGIVAGLEVLMHIRGPWAGFG